MTERRREGEKAREGKRSETNVEGGELVENLSFF